MIYKPPARLRFVFFLCAYSLFHTQILSGPHKHLTTETETSSLPAIHSFLPVYSHLLTGEAIRTGLFEKWQTNAFKHMRTKPNVAI